MPRQEAVPEKLTIMNGPFVTPDWVGHTTIYEVNLRQYTSQGTMLAFMQELPRLKELGVETLWFMPLTPIAELKRKGSLGSYYACSDYTSINPEFGTEEDFKQLVAQAHQLGFKIIIDWVANHTGWDHQWTKLHPDYYLKDSTSWKSRSMVRLLMRVILGLGCIVQKIFTSNDGRLIHFTLFWISMMQ